MCVFFLFYSKPFFIEKLLLNGMIYSTFIRNSFEIIFSLNYFIGHCKIFIDCFFSI